LRLVLVARAREAVSDQITIEVAWNGKWPESAEELARSIVVKEVSAAGQP
jgi:hypothetical protein